MRTGACTCYSRTPPGPLPSTLLLQHLQLSTKLEAAVTASPLSCRRCVLQLDAAGAAARATEAAQELLRQASREGQVSKLAGRRLVSCVSSMRLDALPKGSRDELIAYTAFFAALEVSRLLQSKRLPANAAGKCSYSCCPCALVAPKIASEAANSI